MLRRSHLKWASSVETHIHHAWIKLHLQGGAAVCPVCNVWNTPLKVCVCVRTPIYLPGVFLPKICVYGMYGGHRDSHFLWMYRTYWRQHAQVTTAWQVHVSFSMQHLQCTLVICPEVLDKPCHSWLLPDIWSSWQVAKVLRTVICFVHFIKLDQRTSPKGRRHE